MRFPIDHDDFVPKGRCFVAAAILGAGAMGAGASIWGANRAAGAQTAMGTAALNKQQQMFDVAKQNLLPFINAGTGAISGLTKFIDPSSESSPLNALMKLIMPGPNQTDTLSKTPGFQFTEDRGLRAVNNALAARGLAGSGGAVAKGASDYTTGLASNTWSTVVDKLMGLFSGGAGAMQNLVNTGANAGGSLAGGAITSGGQQAGTLTGIGNAQGGAATAIGNAVGTGANSLTMAALINKLTSGGNVQPPNSLSGLYGADSSVPDPWAGIRAA